MNLRLQISGLALLALLSLAPPVQAEPYPNEGYTPATGSGFQHPGTLKGFNPQPDPPGRPYTAGPQPDPPGMVRGFDPQPDPPGSRYVPAVQNGYVPAVQRGVPAVQVPAVQRTTR